jgi:hypothetical protein
MLGKKYTARLTLLCEPETAGRAGYGLRRTGIGKWRSASAVSLLSALRARGRTDKSGMLNSMPAR